MKSVKNNKHTIIIKNSKFICYIYHIETKEEVENILSKTKEKYYDATHCCYAYILDNTRKESDDGEPSGTAGIPILQVLEKNDLNHVLCIVVRYFGKIKLGAGGLVRAYTKSATETLKNSIINLIPGFNITITFPYEKTKNIDYILKDTTIIEKSFDKKITYTINVTEELLSKLKEISETKITINYNTYIAPNE